MSIAFFVKVIKAMREGACHSKAEDPRLGRRHAEANTEVDNTAQEKKTRTSRARNA